MEERSYEEQPLFTIDSPMVSIDKQALRQKLSTLSPAVVHAFKCIPVLQTISRSRLLDLLRVTYTSVSENSTSCFNLFAIINPSCTPNVSIKGNCDTGNLALFLHDGIIRAGKELCFTYTSSVVCMTTAERQELFRGGGIDSYTCRCATCTAPDPIRKLSDMRRCVMRHLLYLVMGRDLPEVLPKIRGLTKDKPLSIIFRLHIHLFILLAEAEEVETLANELMDFGPGFRRKAMFRGP